MSDKLYDIPEGYLTDTFPMGDFTVETLHEDGQKDIARMIDGHIYVFDQKTGSPIIAYKPVTDLRKDNP